MISVASASPPAPAVGLALHIDVLGPPRVAWDGRSLALPRRQARALLYRLAASPHPAPRDHLAFLFWPDLPDAAARRNLVVLLNHLRRALPAPAALVTAADVVGLDGQAVRSDAVVVAAAIAVALRERRLDRLAAAVNLYRGPFLDGFTVAGGDEFEAWAAREREGWERRRLEALAALVDGYAAQGDHPAAVDAARRYLAADELAEAMHRRLIALYAAAGDRAAALRQFERCAAALERELGIGPCAETRQVYEAARDGRVPSPETTSAGAAGSAWRVIDGSRRRATWPAVASPPSLPIPPTPLIGRAAELAAARARLVGPDARLVTFCGAGGAGKTRLALQVAHDLHGCFADGVAFVALAPLRDPTLVIGAIAQACSVQQSGVTALDDVLRAYLRDKELLLVLDNCEHLPAAAPAVASLLAAAPRLRVLATSRTALHLAGEQALPVPPLPLPDLTRLPPVAELAKQPAVELLVARARAADPAFRLTEANAADVAAICARLDGLPLALELAAARLKLLSPRALRERLDRPLALLAGGPRDLPDRHRTLRATLDWSHRLLGPGERRLFARLAVFAGGWTLAAADVVCRGGGVGDDPASPPPPQSSSLLDEMQALLETHLIVRLGETDGEPRFGMLETIREYALERLIERDDASDTRVRHAAWCATLAETAEPALCGRDQLAWLERLEAEADNLRAALSGRLEHDPPAALRLVGCLWPAWQMRSMLVEGRRWLAAALRAGAGVDVAREVPAAWRVAALLGAGALAREQADVPAARAHLEAGLAIGRALGEPRLLTALLRELGQLFYEAGDCAAARRPAREALDLSRAIGDPHLLAGALALAGELAAEADGDFRRARLLHEEALVAARAAGDRWQLGEILTCLGWVARMQGEPQRAEILLEEGLIIAENAGSPQTVVRLRRQLGLLAGWRGDPDGAEAHYAAGLAVARAHDQPSNTAFCLAALGEAALARGDAARAAPLLDESLSLFATQANARGLARVGRALGRVALAAGDAPRAAECLRAALRHCAALGDEPGIASSLELIARAVVAGAPPPGAAVVAARLLGAATGMRGRLGVPAAPGERAEHQATVRAGQARVGEPAWRLAWAAGETLTPEAAIDEAMALPDRLPARLSIDDAAMLGNDPVGRCEGLPG